MNNTLRATGLRRSLALAVAAPLLLLPTARAGNDQPDLSRVSNAALQDLGALLRPQSRRASAVNDTPGAQQWAALATRSAGLAVPPSIPAALAVTATPTAPAALPVTAAALRAPAQDRVEAPAALANAQVAAANPQLLATVSVRSPAAATPPEARFDLAINNAPAAQVYLQLASGTPYNMLVSPRGQRHAVDHPQGHHPARGDGHAARAVRL